VTGFELATEPPARTLPPPPLGYTTEHGYESLTDEHFDMAKLGLL
jgi:hypothetical protein